MTAEDPKWRIKGDVIGACNCDYGCPCTFDAPPTYGFCDGFYFIHINDGFFESTRLDGLTIGWGGHAPGALHEGNVTALHVFDERASPEQRLALGSMFKGESGGIPAILAGLTTKIIGPLYVPTQWQMAGDNYAGRASLGDIAEVELDAIKNPVTGVASPFTLSLGNGFLTDRMEMGTTSRFRLNHPDLSYDNSGKFSATFKIDWKGGP
jgi:hypothetical protein